MNNSPKFPPPPRALTEVLREQMDAVEMTGRLIMDGAKGTEMAEHIRLLISKIPYQELVDAERAQEQAERAQEEAETRASYADAKAMHRVPR